MLDELGHFRQCSAMSAVPADRLLGPDREVPAKEYVGYIWIGDEPGKRLSVWAQSADEATRMVVAEYGDATRTRSGTRTTLTKRPR